MMQGEIDSIFRVLKNFKKGHFVLTDEDGDQFVVARKEDFEGKKIDSKEMQLGLPPAPEKAVQSAGDVLEKINRELAMYKDEHEQEVSDDLGIIHTSPRSADAESLSSTLGEGTEVSPPRRIRFEPLRGDLPPDLQD